VKFEWVSGCQVRRLQSPSAALDTESRRDQVEPAVEVVGLARLVGDMNPGFVPFIGVRGEGPYP
jgi:hypothetical protein